MFASYNTPKGRAFAQKYIKLAGSQFSAMFASYNTPKGRANFPQSGSNYDIQ